MGKDFLKELVSEKKLFVIVQSIIILTIILLIIFAGTTKHNTTQNISIKKAVCGDGFLDKGETSETCCLDAGCEDGFTCLRNTNETYTCQKIVKKETKPYIEFLKLGKTIIEQAYNYEKAGKEINLTKKLMEKSINDLEKKGFSTTVEKESYNIIVSHVNLIEQIGKLNKRIEELSSNNTFLKVFYFDKGNPKDVKNELIIVKNNTQQSMDLITAFQNKLKLISNESQKQLSEEFDLNPVNVSKEYKILFEGFKETNNKASKLLTSTNSSEKNNKQQS